MKSLVGFTGFVGSNLAAATNFDGLYNSKNITEAYGTKPDLLIYAGVPAAKYLANKEPEKDLAIIRQAEENIARIAPKKLVLISTIDVFPEPVGVDENTVPEVSEEAYGRNRLALENWIRNHYPDALIIRLPALFGRNLKKNFIYDIMNPIPFRLNEKLFADFIGREPQLKQYYQPCGNGFLQCIDLTLDEEKIVKKIFEHLDFSALNFTDSRSRYQFYPLKRLWNDLQLALDHDLRLLHLATEPITASELYKSLTNVSYVNETSNKPASYDYRTMHGEIFGQKGVYILSKKAIITSIHKFINNDKG